MTFYGINKTTSFKTGLLLLIFIIGFMPFICGCSFFKTWTHSDYYIEREASGKVRSISQGYWADDQMILHGQYIIFKDNGDQIEYTMQHNKRNGIAIYRDSAGNILYSANFINDVISPDVKSLTKDSGDTFLFK